MSDPFDIELLADVQFEDVGSINFVWFIRLYTGPFSLADLNELRNSLLQAEFRDIRSENIQVTFEFDSAEDYVSFTKEIAAPVNLMLANETEKRRDEIWKAVTDQVRLNYADNSNGNVSLNNEAICIAGRRE